MSIKSVSEPKKGRRIGKKFSEFKTYFISWIRTFRGSLTILCLIILSIVPLFTQNSYYLGIFVTAMIFSIFAASWDFLAGFTGQVSFGHAIFFGVAGYVASALIRYFSYVWWLALIFGAIAGVLFGLLIGIPCL